MMQCPLCKKEKVAFEKHHVIWRTDGGTNDPVNLLAICKTCHATINNGDPKDAAYLERECLFHQLVTHGLSFILKSGLLTGRHILKDKLLEAIKSIPANVSSEELDAQLKAMRQWFINNLETEPDEKI